jgi:hypothetical protein
VSGGARCFAALCVLFAAAGCGIAPPPPPVPEPVGPPDAAALWMRARERTDRVSTLRVGLDFVWQDAGGLPPEGCSGSLSYERGGMLRLEARTASFFTVFELVAGRDSVWLDVPRENTTVAGARGDAAWSELPIAPARLLVALLADPWGGAVDGPGPEPELDWSDGQPVLRAPGWALRVDAESGMPAVYDDGTLRVFWNDWALRRGTSWAHDIEVHTSDGVLRVRLGHLLADRNLPAGTFAFTTAEGRVILTPDRAKQWWIEALRGD